MKCLKYSVPFFVILILTGCGSEAPTKSTVPQSLTEAHASLPDSGYWLCRVDYNYFDRSYGTQNDGILVAGEGRAAVKRQITESCLAGYHATDCISVIEKKDFKCVRAQNTGGLAEYPNYVVCNLPFTYFDRSYGTQTDSYRTSASNQGEAMKKIFDLCRGGYHRDECSNAIYRGAAVCTTVE